MITWSWMFFRTYFSDIVIIWKSRSFGNGLDFWLLTYIHIVNNIILSSGIDVIKELARVSLSERCLCTSYHQLSGKIQELPVFLEARLAYRLLLKDMKSKILVQNLGEVICIFLCINAFVKSLTIFFTSWYEKWYRENGISYRKSYWFL